jgi:two-component sensor histidine kinase
MPGFRRPNLDKLVWFGRPPPVALEARLWRAANAFSLQLPIVILRSLPFRKLPGDRPALGVAVGIAFLLLASVLRWLLGGMSEGFGPMTFPPAILLAGLFGGIRIGLAFAAVCTFIAWVLFFPPYGTFTLATPHRISMLIFVLTASLELYVIWSLNVAIHALALSKERSNTLFRELQHRVANNLQFVSAVLWARRKALPPDSPGMEALDAARGRLQMMSRVHRRLHDPKSVEAPIDEYLRDLCTDLIQASDTPGVRLTVNADRVVLNLEALMSVSLIVAELVTNSLKHAFAGRVDGAITVSVGCSKGHCTLSVADDGPGMPASFDKHGTGSLGQGILQSLARQLRGTISYERDGGTVAKIDFPSDSRSAVPRKAGDG